MNDFDVATIDTTGLESSVMNLYNMSWNDITELLKSMQASDLEFSMKEISITRTEERTYHVTISLKN